MELNRTLRDQWSQTEQGWQITLPTGWNQGRSLFGGLTAAAGVALAARHVTPGRALRTVAVQLLRPCNAGLVHGTCRTVREGKNVTFLEVHLHQNDKEVAMFNLVFVQARDSKMVVEGPPRPEAAAPDTLPEMPYVEGLTPEFTQHFAFRWAHGGYPYAGGDEAHIGGHCRIRVPAGDEEGMVALMDAWPCPSLCKLTGFAPASTVSWTAHLFDIPEDLDGWSYFDYRTQAGAGGFHTAVGHLYSPAGKLIGWTEQLVAVFD